jgi:hypothetical protein
MQVTKPDYPMETAGAQGQDRDCVASSGARQPVSKHFGGETGELALIEADAGMGNGSHGQNKAGDRPGVVASSIMADPTKPFRAHKRTRSAVANRPERLDQIDGRSVMYRRFKDVVSAILVDLGGASRFAHRNPAKTSRAKSPAADDCCPLPVPGKSAVLHRLVATLSTKKAKYCNYYQ